jgi:3-hydroxypropionyl-CoA synthetase (ADP-forming)
MQFTHSTIESINAILRTAHADGRSMLYEHEVYGILENAGLQVPRFEFVQCPSQVTGKLLEKFGRDLVVKIVSPQIAHKQKLGGVKKVSNTDPLFLQFVLSRMKEEVLSHFADDSKPDVQGFLLVEFLPHTQALGYEVLIGFKEDAAFGPVLTMSKGGDDAEFFAKYYDPANLFIPPLDYEQAFQLVNTLNIRHKFEQIGHPEYAEHMARATSVLSWLSWYYSFTSEQKPEFIITEMDVNPFVISSDNRFVAIDGYAKFVPAVNDAKKLPVVDTTNLDSFFHPHGIAVIGVSADVSKASLGRDISQLLHDLGRKDLYLVNAKGGTLTLGNHNYPLYKALDEIPGRVDLVVYAAPAQFTVDFLKSLREDGPKAIILISGVPQDIKYPEFERQLDAALPEGVRIIGPNCMGVFFAPETAGNGLNTLFINEERLELKYSDFSNTVLLTQSGALAVTAIDKLQKTRVFKSVVSFGNKYDVKISDLMAYFAEEESIDLISLYIEGLDAGEGRQFFQLAQKITKPIIAYKSGRTEAGAKAAASHTASMSGSYDVFRAACMQSGVILAEKIEDHYDFVKVFSLLAHRIPSGNRVAGVVNAGFESTVGADELKNLKQAQLSPASVEKLNKINKYGLVDTTSPFLDVTPMADDRMYADFVEAVLQDENVDCVFVAIVPHAVTLKTDPGTCRDEDGLANLLANLSKKYDKPMVVSVNAGRYYQDFVAIMEENGLPVYSDIRSAIKSLDTFVTYHTKTRDKGQF